MTATAGLLEHYAMDAARAHYVETPQADFVARHEREIVPLLKLRPLFAGWRDFRLYDFERPDGKVDEDVYVVSNRRGGERYFVAVHNRRRSTRGRIRRTVPSRRGGGELARETLTEALGLPAAGTCMLHDVRSGALESCDVAELRREGLELELGPYASRVLEITGGETVMIDLVIVLAFVAYSVTVGFRARRQASKNLREYFLAGQSVRGWRAGVSMAATQFAADTPLLVMGLLAAGGIFSLWRLWIYGLAFLMMGFVFGRAWRRAGVLTDAELTEIRYSGGGVLLLRGLKAVYYGTVIN